MNRRHPKWWNRLIRKKQEKKWNPLSQVKSLRVIGKDCEFAIADRCSGSRNAKGKRHGREAIVIKGGSACFVGKELGLYSKCFGMAYKLAT